MTLPPNSPRVPSPAALAGKRPAPTPAAATAAPASDPSKWGRVDESGAVWLRTADGERQVGSWQAGDAEAGLAHFGRRYDDLATEVALLEARLESGTADPRETATTATQLRDSLASAAVVGDLDALAARLTKIVDESASAGEAVAAKRKAERQAQREAKEALVAEAEQIGAESTAWKASGDRLQELFEQWKVMRSTDRRADRKADDALWHRFSKARDAFNRRRGAHFAELDRTRAGAREAKQELIAQAQELATSTDWNATAARMRSLMDQWKAAGRASRDTDDALWAQFKAAQDAFFAARSAANDELDAELETNAEAKAALLARTHIDPKRDVEAARTALRKLQREWEAIGRVPRNRVRELEGKLRDLERRVDDAAAEQWRKTDPEVLARVAQFQERAKAFEAQAERAEAAGRSVDAEKARAQAAQWAEWARTAEQAVS